ncbi:MAG: ribose 5-phosphate isomerase B [Bacteroidales bacterium]|jgi:ribose 5-phosphate isomerase B|nr:ribose 5-phosphate isomerase B [Bacteroidales bacterium]
MNIIIASDHAGFNLKSQIMQHYADKYCFSDCGAFSAESVDYPDFAHQLVKKMLQTGNPGILICGTGNGMAITANKYAGIRAALCWKTEIAELARRHNNANVLVLPARHIDNELAFNLIDLFFTTSFEGGRHEKRVQKIDIQ